jgi:hypothetical protein
MQTFTVTTKGSTITFESTLTDAEAVEILRTLALAGSNFASDLRATAVRYGLSEKQRAWAHKLAMDTITPKTPKAPEVLGDFSGLIARFDAAAEHLKRPKIRLTLDGVDMVLARCGERSAYAGAINLKSAADYDAAWYGRINRDGSFVRGRECTDEVFALVERLAADPVGVATEHGKASGACCFCSRELTDARSLAVGYGPICATNFRLPYGEKTEVAA